MKTTPLNRLVLIISLLLLFSCVSVPPEVINTQQKELEIIKLLQSSHIAMIDAYVDQKNLVLEDFFFKDYVLNNNYDDMIVFNDLLIIKGIIKLLKI